MSTTFAAAAIESLESRTLLSDTIRLPTFPDFERPVFPPFDFQPAKELSFIRIESGVLLINGTHKNDRITVTRLDQRPKVFDATATNLVDSNAVMVTSKFGSIVLPVSNQQPESLLLVRSGGERYYVDAALIDEIRIDGGGGNDIIRVGRDVRIDADLRGGVGNDTLEAGQRNDFLRGGNGDDTLIAVVPGPMSRYQGGAGLDRISGKFDGSLATRVFALRAGIEQVEVL